MKKVLIVDADKCTGCRICELVCSISHHGEFNPKKSYVRVIKNKEMDINIITVSTKCDYCGECIESCLPEALTFVDFEEAILKWKSVKIGSFPAPLFGT
jgi:anaerobic carbon-monoxide dehydrogenase iron sulfur subunit